MTQQPEAHSVALDATLRLARSADGEPATARIMVYLPASLKARVEAMSITHKVPQTALVRAFIQLGLREVGL